MEQSEMIALIDAMKKNGLTHLKIKKQGVTFEARAEVTEGGESFVAEEKVPAVEAEKEAEKANYRQMKAPLVGVFYAAPAPGEVPFCQVGDRVREGDVLCILEAMKVMNEVTAPVSGVIASIEKSDGALCEVGEVLLSIKEETHV